MTRKMGEPDYNFTNLVMDDRKKSGLGQKVWVVAIKVQWKTESRVFIKSNVE